MRTSSAERRGRNLRFLPPSSLLRLEREPVLSLFRSICIARGRDAP